MHNDGYGVPQPPNGPEQQPGFHGGPGQSPYGAYGFPPGTSYPPTVYDVSGRAEMKAKLGKLAWAAVIIGIVGIVFSVLPIVNYLTAFAAIVGAILGVIAFFGSRRVLSLTGIGLCVLALVFTVKAQNAFAENLQESFPTGGSTIGSAAPATLF